MATAIPGTAKVFRTWATYASNPGGGAASFWAASGPGETTGAAMSTMAVSGVVSRGMASNVRPGGRRRKPARPMVVSAPVRAVLFAGGIR